MASERDPNRVKMAGFVWDALNRFERHEQTAEDVALFRNLATMASAQQEPERDKEVWAEIYDALFELLGREPTWAESVIAQEAMKATLRARVQPPSTSKGVAAYAPSHWRETLADPEAKTIIGVTLHPDDAEDWVPVLITPTEGDDRGQA